MSTPHAHFDVDRRLDVYVVRLSASFRAMDADSLARLDDEIVRNLLAGPPWSVLLNMAAVTYFHSQGISFLLRLKKRLEGMGGELRLCALQPQASEILTLTCVSERFRSYASEESGVRGFMNPDD